MSYYLDKGIEPEKILNLTPREKDFYLASSLFWAELRNKDNGKI